MHGGEAVSGRGDVVLNSLLRASLSLKLSRSLGLKVRDDQVESVLVFDRLGHFFAN